MQRMNPHSQPERVPVILVVEDEETVLGFLRDVLEVEGYRVLTARNSVEALHTGAAFRGTIDVLVTDVRMRVFQNGLELARCFGVLRPETAVLLISGSCLPRENGREDSDWAFLPKPFNAPRLSDAIGALLGRGKNTGGWIPSIPREMHLA